jgi:hypothetical protein
LYTCAQEQLKLEHETEMEVLEEVLRKSSTALVKQTREEMDQMHMKKLEGIQSQHEDEMQVRNVRRGRVERRREGKGGEEEGGEEGEKRLR